MGKAAGNMTPIQSRVVGNQAKASQGAARDRLGRSSGTRTQSILSASQADKTS